MDINVSPEEYAAIISQDQLAFTEEAFGIVSPADTYLSNWHVECIIEYLKAVETGEFKRLIINMPPRAMKSISVSIAWPAWLLGKNPRHRIICACYGDRLSKRLSVDTRLVINSTVYKRAFPHTRIAYDQNEKTLFKTTQQGFRMATSVGGSVTGDGGDFLIIDDPIKPDESLSQTSRETANMWITNTFLQRQNKPGESRVVQIMQRLHEDDPTGHLIEKGGWETLILPAEFKEKTIIEIGKKTWEMQPGELLHAERLGRKVLDEKLTDLGPYGYAGQYMQTPVPVGGGEFKMAWIQRYNNLDKNFSVKGMNIYIIMDAANTKKSKRSSNPDFTVMVVVGLHSDNNYYLLDLVRDRLNPTERVDILIELHQHWNDLSGKGPKVITEQYGMMTESYYLKKAQEEINYRFPVIEVGGRVDKNDRIREALIPLFEKGRILLPKRILYTNVNGDSHELVRELIDEEMMTFPKGRHDDMLDAFSRILDNEVNARFPKIRMTLTRSELASEGYDNVYEQDAYDPNNIDTW